MDKKAWSSTDGSNGFVHLVGPLTEEVFGFLGPATAALTDAGIQQTVVMMDIDASRYLHGRFHPGVDLVLSRANGSAAQRWQQAGTRFTQVLRQQPWQAVHAHGFLSGLAAVAAVRAARLATPIYYSPHGSRSLASFRRMSSWLLEALSPHAPGGTLTRIAGLQAEAACLPASAWQGVEVVEHPVAAAFFDVQRHETPHPLIVTSGNSQNPGAARDFEQIAIVLSGEVLRISFNWIGTTTQACAARLTAANVSVTNKLGVEQRASRLAASWVYVAPRGGHGFPLHLAEAMSVGLPCVVADTPPHRDVLSDGETGFLCTSAEQTLTRIGQLLDDRDLRARMGDAARDAARLRFANESFGASVLQAYGL